MHNMFFLNFYILFILILQTYRHKIWNYIISFNTKIHDKKNTFWNVKLKTNLIIEKVQVYFLSKGNYKRYDLGSSEFVKYAVNLFFF